MNRLKSLLKNTSSVKSLVWLFFSSHAVLLLMMTFTIPKLSKQVGASIFDMRTFGYSISDARMIINNLDVRAAQLYLFPQLTLLDLFYPFLLALFLSSLLFRLISLTKSERSINAILLLTPFSAMAFDYLENVCVILMITKSIALTESFVLLSSTATILKGTLTSIAWISILIYALIWFRLKILERKRDSFFIS